MHKIATREIVQAEIALLVAIVLQIIEYQVNHGFTEVQFFILLAEIAMVSVVSLSLRLKSFHGRGIHRVAAIALLILLSAANLSSLVIVLQSLIAGSYASSGLQLLASAVAIFVTNIIVFALWYWEIDSPGLTRRRWSDQEKDFQFTQQDMKQEFPHWRPEFVDYLYLSVTNAVNFAPADTRPLTRSAKLLMSSQALISVFTLALVIAKSVSILG